MGFSINARYAHKVENMTDRLNEVVAIEQAVAKAREEAIERIKAIQAGCPHPSVVHGGDRRICAACGLEEAGEYSWWPTRTTDGGFYEFLRPAGQRTILNTDFVKQDSVVNYRVRV